MLPMFPRYPIVTAGFMAPLLFTGILHSAISIVSPILNQRIDWFWFVISQIAFGLMCGFVVNLQAKVRTPQFRALPFSVRAGLHSDLNEWEPPEPTDSDDKDASR
jgi:flagellar biosynthesis protein FliR